MNAAIVDTDVVSMLFKGDLDRRCWIAASALYYRVPLITNNYSDYTMVDGLDLLTAS